jgi:hypothetical protein
LPAGNPVITGTTISSTWANTTLNDIASALTGSVASDGQTPMTGNLAMGGYNITNAGSITATSLVDSGLTAGRIIYASTSGLLANSSALTYDGTTVTSIKFAGALDGTVGATTASTGSFTTVKASTTMGVGGATPSTSGAGITFPATQSASSNANTLDDYEEGTWTPVITSGSGSLTAYTSSGTYIKIGKFVFVWFRFDITTAGTASGIANAASLPFVTTSNTGSQTTGNVREDNVTGTFYASYVPSSSTSIQISQFSSFTLSIDWVSGYAYTGTLVYQTTQ